MKYETKEWLAKLTNEVHEINALARGLESRPVPMLTKAPAAGKWSVAQVIEHLNSYNRYYLHHIEQALRQNTPAPAATFAQGVLGGYFTRMMYSQTQSTGNITNRMQAPKDHTPVVSLNAETVLAEFYNGQEKLLKLLHAAHSYNLAWVKVPISISRFIKLRLGDTFGFLVAHQVRHMQQVKNTLAALQDN